MAENSYISVRKAGVLVAEIAARFSALGHTHDAADISSGVMEPDRLPFATTDEAAAYLGTGTEVKPGVINVAVATLEEAIAYLKEH